MKKLAAVLRPYAAAIGELFRPEVFAARRAELVGMEERLERSCSCSRTSATQGG